METRNHIRAKVRTCLLLPRMIGHDQVLSLIRDELAGVTGDMSVLAGHFHELPNSGTVEMHMSKDRHEMQRILQHADETGHAAKTCRYFEAGRGSFQIPHMVRAAR